MAVPLFTSLSVEMSQIILFNLKTVFLYESTFNIEFSFCHRLLILICPNDTLGNFNVIFNIFRTFLILACQAKLERNEDPVQNN